ncbi:MAG: hypothetical protein D6814_15820 [Calditrichaeota bacterium]|nr:MAG: hypothetical protein D6814_15820 [Calditrichota bacterium]
MRKLQFFCDFDGTAASRDVGQQLFVEFGDLPTCEAAVSAWMRGQISSAEMYRRECQTLRITPKALEQFAMRQKLDEHFPAFVHHCHQAGDELFIVSDGFAAYIRLILNHYALNNLTLLANDINLNDHTKLEPVFPYLKHSCGACANCKGYHVRKHRRPGTTVVYIGDGFSDRCGAKEADIIFAKHDLAAFCKSENIPFIHFSNFADVLQQIEKIRCAA